MNGRRNPVVVVGGGAAGLMAALFAAESGANVLLVERTRDGGRKIVMSGGGRCNVLPSAIDPSRFVTASSPNTMRKLLLAWPLDEQRRFFEAVVGIPLALEAETGKLFPVSNRSRDVRDALVALAERRGVERRFDTRVTGAAPGPDGGWRVTVESGEAIRASSVVLATGGLSVPATGSDGDGLAIAGRLGHAIHDTYPALTPLVATPHRFAALSGISLSVALEAPLGAGKRLRSEGGFLFTHKGYSGPAVLNLSHLCVRARLEGRAQPVLARWTSLDETAWERELREGEGTLLAALRARLPARLAEALLEESGVDGAVALGQLRREDRRRVVLALTRFPLFWTGDEGYTKAEVTGGGVSLAEVEPRTLESRRRPGLFLCGEMLDAFGPIGGYNFAWAWSTGRAAGIGAALAFRGGAGPA
ncbi:MAG TPA: aminoacetone oxidase family FAD-binding enzyme [Candidatus Binatia bacterium]|nr:aminoacetone oxidase family FAD-binding enzyme [Candidatus Binatia bacterium]